MEAKFKDFAVKVKGVSTSDLKEFGRVIEVKSYEEKSKSSILDIIKYEKPLIKKEYFQGKIDPVVEDLINIALATFYVDSIVKRDVSKSRFFSRNIKMTVPVNDKRLWNHVKPILENTVSFMTYDVFKYNFIKRKIYEYSHKPKNTTFNSIALFSGGLDSFAGSQFLISNNFKPIFLTINHSGIGKIVGNLYKAIPKDYTKIILNVKKFVNAKEYTQFSRSFLYLAFAVAIARSHQNVNKIFIPENGIIAYQIGLKEGRYGTRTAHPKFLEYFSSLIHKLFPSWNIEISNPFAYKTKGEVAGIIKDKVDLIKNTISCAHIGRWFKDSLQCGMCIPCIIRRISLISNGIYDDREVSKFGIDAFKIDLNEPDIDKNIEIVRRESKFFYRDAIVNVFDLLKLAENLRRFSYEQIILKYPDLANPEIFSMYKRFSEEIHATVNYFEKENSSLRKLTSE